jgi:hypothetical protein
MPPAGMPPTAVPPTGMPPYATDADPSRFIGVPGAPRPGVWDAATTELGPLDLPAGGVFPGHQRPTGVPEPRRSRIAIAMVVAFVLLIAAVVWLTHGSAPAGPTGTGTGTPTADVTTAAAPVVPPPTASATPSASPSATPSRTASPSATRRPTATPTRPAATTGAPAGPAAAPLTVGARRSLRLAGTTSTYVVRASGIAALAPVTTGSSSAQRAAASFTVVGGLDGGAGCISFRADSGAYMRHRNFQIFVQVDNGSDSALFRRDATFCPQGGSLPGSYVFRSKNYPDYALHARGGELWIDKNLSSFVVTAAWG